MHILHDWVEETHTKLEAARKEADKKPKWTPPKEEGGCPLSKGHMVMFAAVVGLAAFGAFKLATKK